MYLDSTSFFAFVASQFYPHQQVDFSFNSSLVNPTTPCSESCNCQSCQSACTPPNNLHVNDSICTFHSFGTDFTCPSVLLVLGYVALVMLGFVVVVVIIFSGRKYGPGGNGTSYSINPTQAAIQDEPSRYLNKGKVIRLTIILTINSGIIQRYWLHHGKFVARHPYLTIMLSMIITAGCGMGLLRYSVQNDPASLFVGASSSTAMDRNYYESNFGAYPRVEQLIITLPNSSYQISDMDVLSALMTLQQDIAQIQITNDGTFSTKDLCYQPTPGTNFVT